MSNTTQYWLNLAEQARREKPHVDLDTAPIPDGTEGEVVDYAEPMAHIGAAVSHLNEALPGRQKERALAAMAVLSQARSKLFRYMQEAGYYDDTQYKAEAGE